MFLRINKIFTWKFPKFSLRIDILHVFAFFFKCLLPFSQNLKKLQHLFLGTALIHINMVSLCSSVATLASMVLKGNGSISSMLPFFYWCFFKIAGRVRTQSRVYIRISIAAWRRKLAFGHFAATCASGNTSDCRCAKFGRFCRGRSGI